MKLRLTSAGIRNKSLDVALKKLVDRKIKIAFILTAATSENEDKRCLIDNFVERSKFGRWKKFDV